MYADDEVENHAESKRQSGEREYQKRSSFAEDFDDDERFETVVGEKTDKREE